MSFSRLHQGEVAQRSPPEPVGSRGLRRDGGGPQRGDQLSRRNVRSEDGQRPQVAEHRGAVAARPGLVLGEFADQGGEGATPYEVLLHAAMEGQTVRFTRQDGVEETWRIMQPLLDAPPPVHAYAPGSWGPQAANDLVAGHGRWHDPWT